MGKIYTLEHPVTGEIRYIGATTQTIYQRLGSHIRNARSESNPNHRTNWINGLLKQGMKPIIRELDETKTIEEMWDAEIYWIAQFKSWGFRLVNSTEGGEVPLTKNGEENPNFGNKYRHDLLTTKGKVIQLDLNGNYIRTLKCMAEGELFDLSPVNIGMCLNGKRTQHKGFQFIYENEYAENVSYIYKPKNTQKRKIVKLTLEGNFIEEFQSISEASDGKTNKISEVCRGKRNHCWGFKWMFSDEYYS